MTTLSGTTQKNTAGNRSWRTSLDYSLSSTETTTTVSTSLYAELITNGKWNNVYFTTRSITVAGTSVYSASTQVTLNWSAKGRKLITTPSTKPSYTRGCVEQTKSISASIKHKESGKTSTASGTFSVPARELYTITYNANGGTLGANTVSTCANCGANHKSYGFNCTLSSVIPTRKFFVFTGWNTSADGTGTAYSAGAIYTANASVTLYAQWKPTMYARQGGAWKPITQVYVKINGTWKIVNSILKKVNGAWKQ